MPYRIFWLIENRVLLGELHGEVDYPQVEQFSREIYDIFEATYQPGMPKIHLIVNGLPMTKVEFSLKMLQSMVKSMKRSEGLGWNIEIVNDRLHYMFAALTNQFSGNRSKQFYSLKEALEFLKVADKPLAPELDDTIRHLSFL